MAQDFALAFYHSKAWLECRAGYINSVLGLCKHCHKQGLIVHHIVKLTPENINNPSITLDWSNLMYLCLDCHNAIHADKLSTKENYYFDEKGNLCYAPLKK